MTLIKSISGIRGTIGGQSGEGLTPIDILKFTSAYIVQLQNRFPKKKLKVVVGRDARISGNMVNRLVTGTMLSMGVNVVDLGLSTTPTVEMAVIDHNADGGVILTASHNPRQWNALKLLNEKGEFLSAKEGSDLLEIAETTNFNFADIDNIGQCERDFDSIKRHIEHIQDLELVDIEAIERANFTVAIDAVNSTGGIALPQLLKALGVSEIIELYTDPTGEFPHNPEPLPEHLTEISKVMKKKGADVGFVVDPDVDRLAIVMEDGEMFGEEYTLVSIADYVLQNKKGNTVSNMSSTRALRDVTEAAGGTYEASAVGEVNVVEMMKSTNAVIGGEGNGGVIYPELHYGRDSLVGIALFLTYLAKNNMKVSELRATYPSYFISKNKIQLNPAMNVDVILEDMARKYSHLEISTIDGVKIYFDKEWVHLRKSNTEPIIRIYSESTSIEEANRLAYRIMDEIKAIG